MLENIRVLRKALNTIVENDYITPKYYPFSYSADEVLFELDLLTEMAEKISENPIQSEILDWIIRQK